MVPTNNGTQNAMGSQLLYPINDPDTAFRSAMRDVGLNPYNSGNPFMRMLQESATGARNAFLMGQAGRGGAIDPAGGGGDTPSDVFGRWLRDSLRSGGLFGNIMHASNQFGGALDAVRNYDKQVKGGADLTTLSPYDAALANLFGGDNGMGAASAYAALGTPLMGRGIGQAWSRGVQGAAESSLDRFARNSNYATDPNDDVWRWMFPGGGRSGNFF